MWHSPQSSWLLFSLYLLQFVSICLAKSGLKLSISYSFVHIFSRNMPHNKKSFFVFSLVFFCSCKLQMFLIQPFDSICLIAKLLSHTGVTSPSFFFYSSVFSTHKTSLMTSLPPKNTSKKT